MATWGHSRIAGDASASQVSAGWEFSLAVYVPQPADTQQLRDQGDRSAARPLATTARAILCEASSIISSPSMTAPRA